MHINRDVVIVALTSSPIAAGANAVVTSRLIHVPFTVLSIHVDTTVGDPSSYCYIGASMSPPSTIEDIIGSIPMASSLGYHPSAASRSAIPLIATDIWVPPSPTHCPYPYAYIYMWAFNAHATDPMTVSALMAVSLAYAPETLDGLADIAALATDPPPAPSLSPSGPVSGVGPS